MNATEQPTSKARPPQAFYDWWQPHGVDKKSGASVGGHSEAYRTWAKRDTDQYGDFWRRERFGMRAETAWNTYQFRSEFLAWVKAGKPEREDFISIPAPAEKLAQFGKMLGQIARKLSMAPAPQLMPRHSAPALEPIDF
jgi:hypothetical protein